MWLWVGPEDSPLLQQLQMTLHGAHWVMYSPSEQRWQVLEPGYPIPAIQNARMQYGKCWRASI